LFPAAISRAPRRSSPACRSVGKAGKLAIAKGLLRAVGDHFGPLYLLLDAWDMRRPLIRAVQQLGRDVIGQVRRDTTLFRLSSPRMPGDRGGWARQRLLLSTDPTLSAPAIVEVHFNRWSAEPLFYALKLTDGMGAMWQRGRTALLRCLHLVQIGHALLVLLTARVEPEILALIRVGGWRKAATLTPSPVKDALASRFRNFQAFRLVLATDRKSRPIRSTGPPGQTIAA
jgi:hypothetical protein